MIIGISAIRKQNAGTVIKVINHIVTERTSPVPLENNDKEWIKEKSETGW